MSEPNLDFVREHKKMVLHLDVKNERKEAQLQLEITYNSRSAVRFKEYPQSVRIFIKNYVRSRPAKSEKKVGMRPCAIIVDRDNVRHTFTRVPQDARRASRSAQRQNSLEAHRETNRRGHVERLEQDLRHALKKKMPWESTQLP